MIELRRECAAVGDPVLIKCPETDGAAALARCLDLAVRLGHAHVLVDLGARQDADASVLSELHRTARALRDAGGKLGVIARTPCVRRLLDLTLLSQGFAVYPTRAHALQAFDRAIAAASAEAVR